MGSLSKRAKRAGFKEKPGPVKGSSLLLKQKRNRTGVKGKRIRVGRGQKWNRPKTFKYVCERVSAGNLITAVCREIKLSHMALMVWILQDTSGQFALSWQRAKEAQAHALAARALRITQGRDGRTKAVKRHKKMLLESKDPKAAERIRQLETNRIHRNRLELDGIKWYSRVMNPREFGDKVDVTSGNQPLPPAAPQSLIVQFVEPTARKAK